ncbi:MAG TPA: hypothetical protein VGF99_19245, partial [Myxococcota bacterium]
MFALLFVTLALSDAAVAQTTEAREADMFGAEEAPPPPTVPPTEPAPSTAETSETPETPVEPAKPEAPTQTNTDTPVVEDPTTTDPATGDNPSRDDAIFGSDDSAGDAAASDEGGVDTLRPGALSSIAPTAGLLESADNFLAIGGQLFLRLNGQFREGEDARDAVFTGPSLLDAFADVRPNDRLRAYAQLRFNFDYTATPGELNAFGQPVEAFSLQLAQAWTKFDIGRVAYVTAGRQRIRWGTGRFWNPTDFVNQEVRNSIDFFDQRVGVDLLKVHFPIESLGWNFYLISIFNNLDVLGDIGFAGRAEFLFGPAELALSSFLKRNAPLRFGADFSAGVWLFDVRAEGVLSRGLGRTLYEGDIDTSTTPPTLPTEVADVDTRWWFEGVFGIEAQFKYTDQDTINVGAEYFYNQAGYPSAKLYPWLFLNG